MEFENLPVGIIILLLLAALILLTPGGRSLLWGRWGMIEPKRSTPKRRRHPKPPAIGGPFGRGSGSGGFGRGSPRSNQRRGP